jgi:putative aminopeptidase FrvX
MAPGYTWRRYPDPSMKGVPDGNRELDWAEAYFETGEAAERDARKRAMNVGTIIIYDPNGKPWGKAIPGPRVGPP